MEEFLIENHWPSLGVSIALSVEWNGMQRNAKSFSILQNKLPLPTLNVNTAMPNILEFRGTAGTVWWVRRT